jgi:hypothetical protein
MFLKIADLKASSPRQRQTIAADRQQDQNSGFLIDKRIAMRTSARFSSVSAHL